MNKTRRHQSILTECSAQVSIKKSCNSYAEKSRECYHSQNPRPMPASQTYNLLFQCSADGYAYSNSLFVFRALSLFSREVPNLFYHQRSCAAMAPYSTCLDHFLAVMALALQNSQSTSLCGNFMRQSFLLLIFNPSVRHLDCLALGDVPPPPLSELM